MSKIVSAVITTKPKTFLDKLPLVIATFDDGSEKELFAYYPDEISFNRTEFIGLTEKETYALKYQKDVDYIRA